MNSSNMDTFSSSESDFSYDDDYTDNESDEDSAEQTIESQRLIAIGVLQQDDEAKPPAVSDETVANRIAKEEYETKMRIKEERQAAMGRASKRVSSEQDRQAKMRTHQARKGIPRTRPQRGKPKDDEEESVAASSAEASSATVASENSRSISSGIDLDEKTRQRILSRSALRYAQQRRTNTSRPSDDKRNLRITPKTAINGGQQQQERPCDEKAAFRRNRPRRARAQKATLNESLVDSKPAATEDSNAPNLDTDLEEQEQQVFEEEEPEVLPGAFAVSGIGDDGEDGNGISGYDSGFEEHSLLGTEDLTDLEEGGAGDLPLDGDIETAGSAMVEASNVISTPLTAELYEADKGVAAVSAKVVLADEEEASHKIRKLSIQIAIAFLVILAIAGTIVGVLLRRGIGNNSLVEQDTTPVIAGWNPIGKLLTVQDPYQDNIRFGNAVAISQDGNRIVVGLPGLDDAEDGSLKRAGSVRIFDLVNGTDWFLVSEIFGKHSNAELGTNVGLSDDGRKVAIGAPSYVSDEKGYVAIYEESNVTGQWEMAANFSSDMEGVFGDAVGFAGNGKVIAIGDKYADEGGIEDVGAVRVYQEVNGTWLPMGNTLVGSKKENFFGWSVAVSQDGSRIAASALEGNQPGNVQVFDFDGTSWEEAGSKLMGESIRESFGVSVQLSGDGSVIAISATDYSRDEEDGVGVVRSYRYDDNEWEAHGQPLEGENKLDAFGSSLSLSQDGSTIAIGGPENGNFCNYCGHIKVFSFHEDEKWESVGTALGKTDIDNGQFGYAVALSSNGKRVVGAAPYTKFDGFFSKVGQVLVFDSIENDAK